MSIFKDTLKPEVIAQLRARQEIISQDNRDGYLNNGTFIGYQTKNSWVRMTSMVDYDSYENITVDYDNTINIKKDQKYTGNSLAKKYILQGGTLLRKGNKESLRYNINTVGGSYGGDIGYSNSENLGRLQQPYGVRPMPGISSVQVDTKSAYGSLREATVKFYCWDRHQLEELEILFMRPGYSVLLEWGWSKYINYNDQTFNTLQNVAKPKTPVNVNNLTINNFNTPFIDAFDPNLTIDNVYSLIDNKIKDSKCNYDALLGYVKNFNWTMLDNGGFECTTTLISIGEVISSLKVSSNSNNGTEENPPLYTSSGVTRPYQYTDYEKVLLSLKAISNPRDFDNEGEYKDVNLKDTLLDINYIGKKFQSRGHAAIFNEAFTPNLDNQPYVKQHEDGDNPEFTNVYNEYISFKVWLAIMDSFFLLKTDKNGKYVYFDVNGIDTTYCLAAPDSISINPGICYVDNSEAFPELAFFYPSYALSGNDGVRSKLLKNNLDIANIGNFYDKTNKYGNMSNIFINLDFLLKTFKQMNSSTNDDGVDVLSYVQNVLNGISTALGGLNNFSVFTNNNIIKLGDLYYIEEPSKARINSKFQFDLIGLKSICRDVNITSKIFQEQSTIIAIGAQNKGNLGDIYSSSQTIFNAGLKDRLVPNKFPNSQDPNDSNSPTAIKNNTSHLYNKLFLLTTYIKDFVVGSEIGNIGQYEIPTAPNPASASSTLRSILLQFNPNINFKALIPFQLEIVLDGMGGFVIGQIFTVNKNILPKDYFNKNLGFIITGISHNLIKNDWTTTLRTQICLLDDVNGSIDKNVSILNDALIKARKERAQAEFEQAASEALNYAILRDYIYYQSIQVMMMYMFCDMPADGVGLKINLTEGKTPAFQSLENTTSDVMPATSAPGKTYRFQSFERLVLATDPNSQFGENVDGFNSNYNNNLGYFGVNYNQYPVKGSSGPAGTFADGYGYNEFAQNWVTTTRNNSSAAELNKPISALDSNSIKFSELLDKYESEISDYSLASFPNNWTGSVYRPDLYIGYVKEDLGTGNFSNRGTGPLKTLLSPGGFTDSGGTVIQGVIQKNIFDSDEAIPGNNSYLVYNLDPNILKKNIDTYLVNLQGRYSTISPAMPVLKSSYDQMPAVEAKEKYFNKLIYPLFRYHDWLPDVADAFASNKVVGLYNGPNNYGKQVINTFQRSTVRANPAVNKRP